MASNPILTFGGECLLGALDIIDAADLEVLLEAGEGIALGMADPDSVLVWPGTGGHDAVLKWGGVLGN